MKNTTRSVATALFLAARALAPAAFVSLAAPACVVEATASSDSQDVTSGTGRFETYKGDDGLHYFQLLAANGERLIRSDGYKSLSSAKGGITSTKTNGADAARFAVQETDQGEAYFTLVASNGQLLALSDTYATKEGAARAIDTAMKTLKTASTAAALAEGPKFETFKGGDGKTYFRLRAGNGQIVLQSEAYSSKSAAEKGISSVKTNGKEATQFEIAEGVDGQHYFRLLAKNYQVIGRSEMYATKSGAIHGAATVRGILLDLAGVAQVSDATIQAELEKAATGLTFMSESDYPFEYVHGALAAGAPITEAVVRAELGAYIEADPAADKPVSSLVAMSGTWQSWKDAQYNCGDPEDEVGQALCQKMRNLEQVLESNLKDVQVFYFGAKGAPGDVQGIGVSVFLVGRSPSGSLVGVRTLAIWT